MKEYLNEKGIIINPDIYSSDGRKHTLTELLSGYVEIIRNDNSPWEIRKSESKTRAIFKMNWDSKKLLKFRKLLGMSQNEFANLIGIHQAVLCNYEKGRAVAQTEIMEKITNICNEWKDNKIKHLQSEIEFIKSF